MRKFFAPLILSLFFFIPFKINASTYTYNFSTDLFSIFEADDFYDFYHSIVDGSSNTVIYYVDGIYRYNNTSYNGITFLCNTNNGFPTCGISSGSGKVTWNVFTFTPFQVTGTVSTNRNVINGIDNFNKIAIVIFSSIPLSYSSSDVLVYNIGSDSFTCDPNNGCNVLPSLLDLYKMHHSDPTLPPSPPTPEYNTPLLTTFYSVVIDKIEDICTFFTSNYLYLSVFVIFLFYISILLLRRFIK